MSVSSAESISGPERKQVCKKQASATRLWVIIDVFVGQKGKGGVEDERSQEGDGKVFRVKGYIYQKLLKKCLRAAKLLLWK